MKSLYSTEFLQDIRSYAKYHKLLNAVLDCETIVKYLLIMWALINIEVDATF